MPRPNPALLQHQPAVRLFFADVERFVFPEITDALAEQRLLAEDQLFDGGEDGVQIANWSKKAGGRAHLRTSRVSADTATTQIGPARARGRHDTPKARALRLLARLLDKDPRFMRRDWERWRKGDVFPTLDEFLSLYEAMCLIGWSDALYLRTTVQRSLHEFVQAQVQERDSALLHGVEPFLRISAATLVHAARSVNVNHNKSLPLAIKTFFRHLLELDRLRLTPESIAAIREAFEHAVDEISVAAHARRANDHAQTARDRLERLTNGPKKEVLDDKK